MSSFRLLAIVILTTTAVACTIDPLPPRPGQDADTGSGTGTGGAGTTGTGGTAGTAGATATGGASSRGGGAGGTSRAGGTANTGGTKATGGIGSTGGTTSIGGTTSAGGAIASGGTTATGGASPIAGASAAGGTTSTGGAASGGAGTSGQGRWVKIDSASPQQRYVAVAYDPVLQRAVLFGGVTNCAEGSAVLTTNRTWEWDGASWTLQTPTGDIPSPRCSMDMAFDRVHGDAIVHGGWTPPDNPQAGTYTYNLATHVWTYRGANLANIGCYAIGYDTDAQLVRMFGGNIYSTFYRDVRAWNEGTQTWSSVTPAGPSARMTGGWVYDQARHRFVLFGGASNFSGSVLTDTWEYDPAATTWQQTAITTNHPAAGGPMAYDPKRAVVVMYIYILANGGETWEYDVGTHLWTQVVVADQMGTTNGPAVFYDEKLEAILLVGGCTAGALQNGTWQYIPPQ